MKQKCSRLFSLHKRIFLLAVLFVGSLFLLTHFANVSLSQNTTQSTILQNDNQQRIFSIAEPTPEKPHTLVGAFYDVQNFPNAKLLLNNKDTRAREVRPTLYNLDGQILELPPVQVEAQSFRLINLREWTDFGGNSFRQGSIKLFHLGKDLAIGMQIYLEDEARSLSFEEKLSEIGTYDSRRLEGVWFQPSMNTETKIILTNTSEELLTVSATLSRRPRNLSATQTFILQPHQARPVDLRETFGNAFANSDAVGISLTHNGTASALLARAMVSETRKGYSTVVTLSNPNTAKSNELHGAGLRLGTINDEMLTPILVLRNTNSEETTVKVHIPYTRIGGANKILKLADVNLRGQEIKKISLNEISQTAASGQIKTAGIEIKYQAGNGSVVAQMQSISQSRTNSFRVLLWDAPAQRSSTGGYPWLLEGSSSTRAYIKNVTDEEQNYVSYLTWENGGMYMIGLRRIAPHQTIEIDVRKLRDEQTPDEEGRMIPLEISRGQIQWAFKMRGAHPDEIMVNQIMLVGQMEQTDTTKGISTNYFCQNCCEESGYGVIETFSSGEEDVGSVVQYESYEEGYSCYAGSYRYRTTNDAQWSSSNQNVATISSPGRVTTIGVGETNIKARFNVNRHYVYEPCGGGGDLSPEESGVSLDKEELENTGKIDRVPNLPAPCDCLCAYPSVAPNSNLTVRPTVIINVPPTAQDGATVTFSVTTQGGTPTAYLWSFSSPGGAGNNPQVNFTNSTATTTMAQAHWFANPDTACGSFDSRYTIKIRVSFQGRSPITKEAPFTVSVGSNWGGKVDAPSTLAPAGTLALAFDNERGLWTVVGRGSLQRVPSPIEMRTPQASQFYNKTLRHEEVHVEQYATGIWSDLYQIDNVMPRLFQLTDPNKQVLEQKIFQAVQTWRGEQDQILEQRLRQGEREAYAVSDPIAPRYLFQRACLPISQQ